MATANQKVGSVYEIGIEGVGYMLSDNPERPVRRQTGVLDTQPPGSDDPLSERIGRYDFIGQSEWTGGEGQDLADRPSSDVTRYYYSEGIDPFQFPGSITLLPTFPQQLSDTYANLEMVVVGTDLLVRTADAEYTQISSAGTPTAVATALTSTNTRTSFATDGANWYLTNGSDIHSGTSGAAGSAWSTEDVTIIRWCGDRLMGADTAASPEEIVSFSPTGTGTVVTTVRAGYTVEDITGGGGYVWYTASPSSSATGSYVGYWQVDSDPTNAGIAFEFPPGEHVVTLFYYLGNVFVGVVANVGSSFEGKVYRCVPSDGILTPQLVMENLDALSHPRFAGAGKFVAVATRSMQRDGDTGIIVIDLETGGYARWYALDGAVDAGFDQMYVVNWLGDFAVSLDTVGVYGRDATDHTSPSYVASGFLETSASDLATPALKHLDEIAISTKPLPGTGTIASVAVAYSIDGSNYTTLDTYDTAFLTQAATELETAVTAPSLRLRATLTPGSVGATERPSVTTLLAKTHATGIVDEIIELPINCDDYIANIHETVIAEDSGPGKGMARYRALQELIGEKILFQDVDWKFTGETCLCEVVGVESTSVQVFNQNRNLNDVAGHVAVVTLRSPHTH